MRSNEREVLTASDLPRHNWTRDEIREVYEQPLDMLVGQALHVKRANWADGQLQKSQLLSTMTGGLPGRLRLLQPVCTL